MGETYRSSRKSSLRETRLDQTVQDISRSSDEWKEIVESLNKQWRTTDDRLEKLESLVTKLGPLVDETMKIQNTPNLAPARENPPDSTAPAN